LEENARLLLCPLKTGSFWVKAFWLDFPDWVGWRMVKASKQRIRRLSGCIQGGTADEASIIAV
jgi:hypothetical protein